VRVAAREHATPDGLGLAVRSARAGEAGAVLDHFLEVVREAPYAVVQEPGEVRLTVDRLRSLLQALEAADNGFYLVAEAEEGIVGSLSCNGGRYARQRHAAEVGVHVRREARRRGVGRALLQTAVEAARASPVLGRLHLQVFAPNEAAIELYRACGFREEGRLRGHVRIGGEDVDVLCMGLAV